MNEKTTEVLTWYVISSRSKHQWWLQPIRNSFIRNNSDWRRQMFTSVQSSHFFFEKPMNYLNKLYQNVDIERSSIVSMVKRSFLIKNCFDRVKLSSLWRCSVFNIFVSGQDVVSAADVQSFNRHELTNWSLVNRSYKTSFPSSVVFSKKTKKQLPQGHDERMIHGRTCFH